MPLQRPRGGGGWGVGRGRGGGRGRNAPAVPPPLSSCRPWAELGRGGGPCCPEAPLEAEGAREEVGLAWEGSRSSPTGWRLGERQRRRDVSAEAETKLD